VAQEISLLQREAREPGEGSPVFGDNLDLILDVKVRLEVVVGECQLSVSELFDLKSNSVVELDRAVNAPVDVMLEGKRVARGVLVAVDDSFGVRITELEG